MAESQTTSSLELRLSHFEKLNKLVEMVYSTNRRRQFKTRFMSLLFAVRTTTVATQ